MWSDIGTLTIKPHSPATSQFSSYKFETFQCYYFLHFLILLLLFFEKLNFIFKNLF